MAIRKRFLFFSNKKGSESQEKPKKKKRQRRYDEKEIEEMAPPFCCESNVGRFGKHSQVLKPKKNKRWKETAKVQIFMAEHEVSISCRGVLEWIQSEDIIRRYQRVYSIRKAKKNKQTKQNKQNRVVMMEEPMRRFTKTRPATGRGTRPDRRRVGPSSGRCAAALRGSCGSDPVA